MRIERGRVARAVFPPEEVAQVTAIACELPKAQGVPLSRFSRSELHRFVVEQAVSEASPSTIARWLADDATAVGAGGRAALVGDAVAQLGEFGAFHVREPGVPVPVAWWFGQQRGGLPRRALRGGRGAKVVSGDAVMKGSLLRSGMEWRSPRGRAVLRCRSRRHGASPPGRARATPASPASLS